MTYGLADADELVTFPPVFGEGETMAIMREQWHERHGYYPTVVAVVHVDDAAHVLEALTAHAVQPGDMPYEQAERAAEMYQAEPVDRIAQLLEAHDKWQAEREEISEWEERTPGACEALSDAWAQSDDWAVTLLQELAHALRK